MATLKHGRLCVPPNGTDPTAGLMGGGQTRPGISCSKSDAACGIPGSSLLVLP